MGVKIQRRGREAGPILGGGRESLSEKATFKLRSVRAQVQGAS